MRICQMNALHYHYYLSVPPTAVWIAKKERHLLAGREAEFRCSATGASPGFRFVWLLGDRTLKVTPNQEEPSSMKKKDSGMEVSTVLYDDVKVRDLSRSLPSCSAQATL